MFGRALQVLSSIFLVIGGLALFAMMVHISLDVIAKIVWNAPIIGTLEIVSYIYMVGCTFLPLGYVLQERSLIVVEAFTDWMSPRGLLCLNAVMGVLTVFYFGAMAVMGAIHAVDKTRMGEIQDATYFELPVWPMRWVLALSCTLAVLIAIYWLADDWRRLLRGNGDGQERIGLGDPLRREGDRS